MSIEMPEIEKNGKTYNWREKSEMDGYFVKTCLCKRLHWLIGRKALSMGMP